MSAKLINLLHMAIVEAQTCNDQGCPAHYATTDNPTSIYAEILSNRQKAKDELQVTQIELSKAHSTITELKDTCSQLTEQVEIIQPSVSTFEYTAKRMNDAETLLQNERLNVVKHERTIKEKKRLIKSLRKDLFNAIQKVKLSEAGEQIQGVVLTARSNFEVGQSEAELLDTVERLQEENNELRAASTPPENIGNTDAREVKGYMYHIKNLTIQRDSLNRELTERARGIENYRNDTKAAMESLTNDIKAKAEVINELQGEIEHLRNRPSPVPVPPNSIESMKHHVTNLKSQRDKQYTLNKELHETVDGLNKELAMVRTDLKRERSAREHIEKGLKDQITGYKNRIEAILRKDAKDDDAIYDLQQQLIASEALVKQLKLKLAIERPNLGAPMQPPVMPAPPAPAAPKRTAPLDTSSGNDFYDAVMYEDVEPSTASLPRQKVDNRTPPESDLAHHPC